MLITLARVSRPQVIHHLEHGDHNVLKGFSPEAIRELLGSPVPQPQLEDQDPNANEFFYQIFMDFWKEKAKSISIAEFFAIDVADGKPFTLCYWTLFERISVAQIVDLFSASTHYGSRVVAVLQDLDVESSSSTLPGIIAAPGVYESIAIDTVANAPIRHYTGSTIDMLYRILGNNSHFSIIKTHLEPDPPPLPGRYQTLYICPYRPGVKVRLRILAVCINMPQSYHYLLESFFVKVFGDFQEPRSRSAYGTYEAWRLCFQVRELMGLGASKWNGLSSSFPLNQGFTNHGAREGSPCANKDCERITQEKTRCTHSNVTCLTRETLSVPISAALATSTPRSTPSFHKRVVEVTVYLHPTSSGERIQLIHGVDGEKGRQMPPLPVRLIL